MILLQAIEVEDFGPFKGVQRVEFGSVDLVGIVGAYTGDKDRSNGAGKSYLVDSIPFVLYGHGRVSLDRLIRRGATKCRVSVTFTVDGKVVVIERRRPAGMSIAYESGGGTPQTITGTKACQQYISRTFGTSLDVFMATSFFAQGKADALVAATPTERKEYLYEILGLEAFDRAAQRAGQLSTDANESATGILARITAKGELLTDLGNISKKQVDALELTLLTDKQKLREAAAAYEKVRLADEAFRAAETKATTTAARVPDLKRGMDSASAALKRDSAAYDDAVRLHAKLQREAVSSEQVGIQLKEVKRKKNAQAAAITTGREEIATLEAKVSEAQRHKDNLTGLEGKCPTCQQEVPVAYRDDLLAIIERRLTAAQSEVSKKQSALPVMERSVQKFVEQEDELAAEIRKADKHAAELASAEKEITTREESRDAAKVACDDAAAHFAAARDEAKKAARLMEGLKRVDLDAAQRKVSGLKETIAQMTERVKTTKERAAQVKKLRGEVEALVEDRADHERDMALYEEARKVLGKKGAPALLIDAAVVTIEASANELLTRLMPEYYINIKTTKQLQSGKESESLEFEVSDGVVVRAFESFSGGERMMLNFALRLAVAEAVAVRSERGIGFAVLDEVFGALDVTNRGNVTAALKAVQGRFPQILCISHTDIAALFPRTVRVVKGAGGSIIERREGTHEVVDTHGTEGRGDARKSSTKGRKSAAGKSAGVRAGKTAKPTKRAGRGGSRRSTGKAT